MFNHGFEHYFCAFRSFSRAIHDVEMFEEIFQFLFLSTKRST